MINITGLEQKIIRFEALFDKSGKGPDLKLAMAMRYWLAFVAFKDEGYLRRADALLSSVSLPHLLFMRAFILHELRDVKGLEGILSSMKPYRNALRADKGENYPIFLGLNALLAKSKGQDRLAAKHFKTLEALFENTAEHPPLLSVILAYTSISLNNNKAEAYLEHAYSAKEHSCMFFVCLFYFYQNSNDGKPMLIPFIKWALQNGIFIENIILKNQSYLSSRLPLNTAEDVYRAYKIDWILHTICQRRIELVDKSAAAFRYYNEATIRQLHFKKLHEFLLSAAYTNEIEDVSRYAIIQYLEHHDAPLEMRPFIYHIMLKDQAAYSLELEAHKLNIIQTAHYALEHRLAGRYYNSLYIYLLSLGNIIDKETMSIAEGFVKDLLFAYEMPIEHEDVKKVLVLEGFLRDDKPYEPKGNKLRVNLIGSAPRIICFDAAMRRIIPYEPRLTKLVVQNQDGGLNTEILEHFFDKGHYSAELLIALCLRYMDSPRDKAPQVYEKALANTAISANFKMRINIALGNYYAMNHRFTLAVEYYKNIDEHYIDGEYTEQMLLSYIHAKEMELASRLIIKKHEHINDKSLFMAIKRVISHPQKYGYERSLAKLAYGIQLKGYYDRQMLDFILDHFEATLSQWMQLSRYLVSQRAEDGRLDALILEMAIYLRVCTDDVCKVFVRMAKDKPNDTIVHDYCAYLCYEVVRCGLLPDYATIMAMEELVNRQLGYVEWGYIALTHIYLSKPLSTKISDDIIKKAFALAATGSYFPIYKTVKDKDILLPYIDIKTPFIYYEGAGAAIELHYRFDNKGDYAVCPMAYIGFGVYSCAITHFYNEEIEYFFVNKQKGGSVATKPLVIKNANLHVLDHGGLYYDINNAINFEEMFKYDKVESIVGKILKERPEIRATIS